MDEQLVFMWVFWQCELKKSLQWTNSWRKERFHTSKNLRPSLRPPPSFTIYDRWSLISTISSPSQEDFNTGRFISHFNGMFVLVQYIPRQPKFTPPFGSFLHPCHPRFSHKSSNQTLDFLQPTMAPANSDSEVSDQGSEPNMCIGSRTLFIPLNQCLTRFNRSLWKDIWPPIYRQSDQGSPPPPNGVPLC